jgi:peptide deformylase
MATLLQVAQLGNPVLRQKAHAIENPSDPQVQVLIDNLLATLQAANGVGIAAPQVSESLQLLIIASRPNVRYPHAPLMDPIALINPRVVDHSGETVKDWEGCLSVPGLRGTIARYQEIEVEYLDRNNRLKTQVFTDFVARIFQHEFDHLNGLAFIDRLEGTQDLMTEQEYQNQIVQPQSVTR